MVRKKCGFFGCNNLYDKQSSCETCQEKPEFDICSACRQPEPKEGAPLIFQESLIEWKKRYQLFSKMRDKFPAQFQAEINQILPEFKLSGTEEKLFEQAEKLILDAVKEKGGKRDNFYWSKCCSVCNPEILSKIEDFSKQNPQFQKKIKEIKESENKLKPIVERVIQETEITDESLEEIMKEISAEVFNPEKEKWEKPTNPGNQNDNGKSPKNDKDNNSAKITQLEQEVNQLKTKIQNLKKPSPNSPAPNSDNSDTLRDLENKLKNKEEELKKMRKNKDNPLSNNQSSQNDNSNLTLYLALGASGVVIFILLVVVLILAKKKKKTISNKNKSLI